MDKIDKLNIILNGCLRIYGSDFRERNRKMENVFARGCFYILAKEMTKCTLSEIGEICGGRDHATVLYVTGGRGGFLSIDRFNEMLHSFKEEGNISFILRTETIEMEKKEKLEMEKIDKLEAEILRLQKILNKSKKPKLTIDGELIKRISNMPSELIRDFERTRLEPYLRMNRHLFKEEISIVQ
tara:strand:+ start:7111 stop:7662 length:552 start_codon:yes stop_codon:yes gene_type:complete